MLTWRDKSISQVLASVGQDAHIVHASVIFLRGNNTNVNGHWGKNLQVELLVEDIETV